MEKGIIIYSNQYLNNWDKMMLRLFHVKYENQNITFSSGVVASLR
jgi:hypothetical protein